MRQDSLYSQGIQLFYSVPLLAVSAVSWSAAPSAAWGVEPGESLSPSSRMVQGTSRTSIAPYPL